MKETKKKGGEVRAEMSLQGVVPDWAKTNFKGGKER